MLAGTILSSIALATMAACVPLTSGASPSWDTLELEMNGKNVTLKRGVVNAESGLSKRSVPDECAFGGARNDYSYIQITGLGDGETACVGYDNVPSCGTGGWSTNDQTQIATAMANQVRLDGQSQTWTSGNWVSDFWLFTTAFSNQDTGPFTNTIPQIDTKSLTYYWSRDGDFATVVGYDAICP